MFPVSLVYTSEMTGSMDFMDILVAGVTSPQVRRLV